MGPELFQFEFSHFNEKARWAFDWKRVAHRRRSYLPGLHMLPILRLSGQRAVPVVRVDGRVIAGSDRIIDWLEAEHPVPPLYPEHDGLRREALDLQRRFDADVGPAARRALFFDLLPDAAYAARCFTAGRRDVVAWLYGALFPVTRAVMRRDMRIDADGAARGREVVSRALDEVARRARGSGHLVGDRFSVADLTAAALLSVTVFPPESPVRLPQPASDGVRTWLARWSTHAGTAWVTDVYRRHRGSPSATAS
jgi:glutathione S-transferase